MSTGANFSHVCLRKLYVLCSRGGASLGDEVAAATLLEVAQLALPVLLERCNAMLRAYLEEGSGGAQPGRPLGAAGGEGGSGRCGMAAGSEGVGRGGTAGWKGSLGCGAV